MPVDWFEKKCEMEQQTAQWWKGSSGRTGQLCSSQEFVPSDEADSISTLSIVSTCEKITSGKIEKAKNNIKHTFNIRICFGFCFINIQIKYTSNQ